MCNNNKDYKELINNNEIGRNDISLLKKTKLSDNDINLCNNDKIYIKSWQKMMKLGTMIQVC